jgi:hypothetical protein
MHSGPSTGPRTAEGLERSRRARWKHGQYSAEAQAEQKRVCELLAAWEQPPSACVPAHRHHSLAASRF